MHLQQNILSILWLPQSFTLLIVVGVVMILICFIYKVGIVPRRKLKRIGLPYPAPTFLKGNLFDYGADQQHIAQIEWGKKYGDAYAALFLYIPAVWIANPNTLKTILVKEFSSFSNRYPFTQALSPFDKTLPELKDHDWKRVRTILMTTVTASKLRLTMPIIKHASDEFIHRLITADQKSQKLDIWTLSGQFSIQVILGTAFGIEVGSKQQEEKLIKAASDIFRTENVGTIQIILRFLVFANPIIFAPIERLLGGNFCSSVRHIVEITKAVIKERRNNLAHDRPCRKDVLQYMIEADGSNQLSDDEMISQAFVFLVAGYETTQNALTFACYSLATNPDIQRKLIDEIDSKFPISDSLDYNIVSEMPYLDMVIAETLRLYPPAITTNREVSQSMIIDGIHIPKDVILAIPIYSIHRDPTYWHDPEQFIPERFTSEAKASRNPYAYLPFGIGPRNCVGMRLALLELKVALVKTLQNIEFFANKETEVPLKLKSLSTLSPVNPLYLGIRKRF
ncbi:Cytochrome P450 3A24 [Trichoplax sp. H2]|nr:Cytochrome P450 3A24 [Trichoplax sp. H2]|eukprot:RDD39455.1 Cytochrome P450 3A24 [Trichoplax sp. H2]